MRPLRLAPMAPRAGLVVQLLLLSCLLAGLFHEASAQAASAGKSPVRAATVRSEEGVRWSGLTPAQREVLKPLQTEWPNIEAARKQKWLVLADRFGTMPPDERARITERMSEWARLSPAERGQARLSFQQARDVPLPDRKARWQQYQSLDPVARQKYAAQAASTSTVRNDPGRRDGGPARVAAASAPSSGKTNLVPNPAFAQPPKPITPTLVQAAPGATTTLITKRPMPPAHQQTGMPKIAATPEFVNRSTLLPRRGPQAAGIASAPSIRPPLPQVQKSAAARPAPAGPPAAGASAPLPSLSATP